MKILEVHEVNYREKIIYEFIEIPEALSLRGHEVTVVDFGEGEKKRWKTEVFRGNRVFPDSRVRVVRPGALFQNDYLARISAWYTNLLVLKRLFLKNRFDAVILYSVPTNGWQAVMLAKKHGVPVFFRAIDALYDLRPYPFPLSYIVRMFERFVYKRCDYVLELTPKMGDYTGIKKRLPLYSAVNDNIFFPKDKYDPDLKRLRKKHKIKSRDKLITYIGSFYEFVGLEGFIKGLKRIRAAVPDARLLLVGGGESDKRLRSLARKHGVEKDVIFTGFVQYEDVCSYINLASVCIVPFREVDATRDIVPIKLFQYLGCKKPVICRKLGGILTVVPRVGHGVIFEKTDEGMIGRTIEILKDKKKQDRMAGQGYSFCRSRHTWKVFIDTLEGYLEKYRKKDN
jgi:glycosyltransferase involved in cell wall biosynthesis